MKLHFSDWCRHVQLPIGCPDRCLLVNVLHFNKIPYVKKINK